MCIGSNRQTDRQAGSSSNEIITSGKWGSSLEWRWGNLTWLRFLWPTAILDNSFTVHVVACVSGGIVCNLTLCMCCVMWCWYVWNLCFNGNVCLKIKTAWNIREHFFFLSHFYTNMYSIFFWGGGSFWPIIYEPKDFWSCWETSPSHNYTDVVVSFLVYFGGLTYPKRKVSHCNRCCCLNYEWGGWRVWQVCIYCTPSCLTPHPVQSRPIPPLPHLVPPCL